MTKAAHVRYKQCSLTLPRQETYPLAYLHSSQRFSILHRLLPRLYYLDGVVHTAFHFGLYREFLAQ